MLESRKRQPDAGAVKQPSMSGGRTRFVPHANPCHTQVFRSKVCDSVGLSFTSYLKYSPSKRRKSFQLCRFGPSVAMKVVGGAAAVAVVLQQASRGDQPEADGAVVGVVGLNSARGDEVIAVARVYFLDARVADSLEEGLVFRDGQLEDERGDIAQAVPGSWTRSPFREPHHG